MERFSLSAASSPGESAEMARTRGQRGSGSQFLTTAEDESKIRAELERRGMSQAELARLVDCTPSMVGRIIRAGTRSSFLPRVFQALELDTPKGPDLSAKHARALALLDQLAVSPDRYVEAVDALRALLQKEHEIETRIARLAETVTGKPRK